MVLHVLCTLDLLIPLFLLFHLDDPDDMKYMSKLQMIWFLQHYSTKDGRREKSKSGVTYYVTWRTRRTLDFPIISLLALSMKIRTMMLDILFKTSIPDDSAHCI